MNPKWWAVLAFGVMALLTAKEVLFQEAVLLKIFFAVSTIGWCWLAVDMARATVTLPKD